MFTAIQKFLAGHPHADVIALAILGFGFVLYTQFRTSDKR